MKIIVMGPQGSGKSTQADLLAEVLGLPCLEMGDLLHFISQEETERGRKIKKAMEAGVLVGDETILKVVEEHLQMPAYKKGYVLDGFPRNLETAKEFNQKINQVFYLKVSDKENIKRLVKRGRKDDTPELIKKRLKIYHQETEPVLDYYRQKGILEEVDGERPIEMIHQDIVGRLKR